MGIVLASALVISGQAKTNKVVEAYEFRLVDGSGKVLGSLGQNETGAILKLTDANDKVVTALGATNMGATVTLLNPSGYSALLSEGALLLNGPSGHVTISVEKEAGPNISVTDKEGYSSILGRSDLIVPNTGKKEQTPAASLVMVNKDNKVMWSAP